MAAIAEDMLALSNCASTIRHESAGVCLAVDTTRPDYVLVRETTYRPSRCVHRDLSRSGTVDDGVFPVPYTYNSLAFVWLTILGLFSLTASGVVASPWLLGLTLAALAVPFLILRNRQAVSSGQEMAR